MGARILGQPKDISSLASPYSVVFDDDFFIKVNTSGGPVTINLPTAALAEDRDYIIRKTTGDANVVSIVAAGADLIDGLGSRILANQYDTVRLISDGISWHVVSLSGGSLAPNGTLYVSTPVATTLDAAGEKKVAGTTTGKNLTDFTHSVGRLTYTGQSPIRVLVVLQGSLLSNSPSILAQLRVALNGTGIADSEAQQEIPVGADVESVPVVTTVDLVTNDYLEPFIETPDFAPGVTVTAEKLVMSVIGIEDLSSAPGLQRTYGESLGVDSITGTTAYQTKLTVPMPATSPAGTYRIIWSAEIKNDGTNAEAQARVEDASGIVYAEPMERMAGTPTNQWMAIGGIIEVVLGAGGISFYILYATSSTPRTTSIRRARLEILRVP